MEGFLNGGFQFAMTQRLIKFTISLLINFIAIEEFKPLIKDRKESGLLIF